MKKRGFIQGDWIVYFLIIFAFCIFLIVMYIVVANLNNIFQANDTFPDISKNMVSNFKNRYVGVFEGMVAFLIIGLLIALVIFAFAIRSHPIFIPIAMVVLGLIVYVSISFANSFHSFASTTGISDYVADFNIIPLVMTKLPYIAVIFGVIFVVAFFAKNQEVGI